LLQISDAAALLVLVVSWLRDEEAIIDLSSI